MHKVAEITWVPAEKIRKAARIFATQRPGCIQFGQSVEAGNNCAQSLRALGKLQIRDGDWVWIETPRGRIKQKAELFEGIDPRVVNAQASWWYPEDPGPDHGLFKSNANVLTSNDPPYDPVFGSVTFRAMLCRIYRVKD